MKWTYADIMKAGADLQSSADKINSLIGVLEDLIESIKRNYDSPQSREMLEKLIKIKNLGPEFYNEVTSCSKKLIDEVAPAYAKVEQKNQMGM